MHPRDDEPDNFPSELRAAGVNPFVAAPGQPLPEPARPVAPPQKAIAFTYRLPSREIKQHTLTLRLLSFEERTYAARLVAAELGGMPWESFPEDEREGARARAYCRVAWPNEPPWLQQAFRDDDEFSVALYGRLKELRDAYFRGDHGAGEAATVEPRVVFLS